MGIIDGLPIGKNITLISFFPLEWREKWMSFLPAFRRLSEEGYHLLVGLPETWEWGDLEREFLKDLSLSFVVLEGKTAQIKAESFFEHISTSWVGVLKNPFSFLEGKISEGLFREDSPADVLWADAPHKFSTQLDWEGVSLLSHLESRAPHMMSFWCSFALFFRTSWLKKTPVRGDLFAQNVEFFEVEFRFWIYQSIQERNPRVLLSSEFFLGDAKQEILSLYFWREDLVKSLQGGSRIRKISRTFRVNPRACGEFVRELFLLESELRLPKLPRIQRFCWFFLGFFHWKGDWKFRRRFLKIFRSSKKLGLVSFLRRRVLARIQQIPFSFFSLFVRQNPRIWVFTNEQFSDGNVRAIFEKVLNRKEIQKVLLGFSQKEKEDFSSRGQNLRFLNYRSLSLSFIFARAKVILLHSGHNRHFISRFFFRKKVAQLWHGIPLKTIGYTYRAPRARDRNRLFSYYRVLISSSQADRLAMALGFAPKNLERVHVTGLPRHDWILCPPTELPAVMLECLSRLQEMSRGRLVILYAPTWRENEQYYHFSAQELSALRALLIRKNAIFMVKEHPLMSWYQHLDGFFPIFDDEIFFRVSDQDILSLLRVADFLITDYSSTAIDYMLLNRPILHFQYDVEYYRSDKGRGWIYSDEYVVPGAVVHTFSEVLEWLEKSLTQPKISQHYQDIRQFFHQYADTQNSERVIKILTGEIS